MKSSSGRTWSVGEVAERFGLATHVLRHWEDEHLLEPARDAAGRRRYDRDDLVRVGALGLVGGLGLADLFRLRARGEAAGPCRSVIQVVLGGGP